MPGEIAVIGTGQFGTSVALALTRLGQAVLVVDRELERVQEIAAEVDSALALDTTDERAMTEAGIGRFGVVVVAIGAGSLEASILTTAVLRQMGIPRIVARAVNPLHARVLRSVGAHEVVNPEEEMGRRVAAKLVRPNVLDQIEFGSATLAEMNVPLQFVGKSLTQLDVRKQHGISVIALRREGKFLAPVSPTEVLQGGDVMVVLGADKDIQQLANRL